MSIQINRIPEILQCFGENIEGAPTIYYGIIPDENYCLTRQSLSMLNGNNLSIICQDCPANTTKNRTKPFQITTPVEAQMCLDITKIFKEDDSQKENPRKNSPKEGVFQNSDGFYDETDSASLELTKDLLNRIIAIHRKVLEARGENPYEFFPRYQQIIDYCHNKHLKLSSLLPEELVDLESIFGDDISFYLLPFEITMEARRLNIKDSLLRKSNINPEEEPELFDKTLSQYKRDITETCFLLFRRLKPEDGANITLLRENTIIPMMIGYIRVFLENPDKYTDDKVGITDLAAIHATQTFFAENRDDIINLIKSGQIQPKNSNKSGDIPRFTINTSKEDIELITTIMAKALAIYCSATIYLSNSFHEYLNNPDGFVEEHPIPKIVLKSLSNT